VLIRDSTQKHTQKNRRLNRQDSQKITFYGLAYPKRSSNRALPLHRKALHCQGSRGLPYSSLTIKGSWMYPGESPSLSSALWRQYPISSR